jgi:hypothetical protein
MECTFSEAFLIGLGHTVTTSSYNQPFQDYFYFVGIYSDSEEILLVISFILNSMCFLFYTQ